MMSNMFLSEAQVDYLVEGFMPRVREESVSAMKEVACHGLSIISSAQKHQITHQSLSKNLSKLKELQAKIAESGNIFPSRYLLEQIAVALHAAPTPFRDAKHVLATFCKNNGGEVELGYLGEGIKLYLDNTVTCLFENPDDFEDEWSFDQHEIR